MANQEIERKFLVHVDRLPASTRHGGARLTQGYLTYEPTVRVRTSTGERGEQAWLTVKGAGTVSRAEFEYEIPPSDARAMFGLCLGSVSKVRHDVTHAGHLWQVDAFEGALAGLWLAEIELHAEDERFDLPDWADREVSADPRYANASLAQAGRVPD
jgi:adenylate cyclase